jgi:deazaflavin-dependent oxidoreductase (nitroreductase family)
VLVTDFNTQIIEEFRANGGRVETAGFGDRLVLLHTTGAKTGAARISPVMAFPGDDGSHLIVASKAGAPDNPAWYANLLAHPDVAIEVGTGDAVETLEVTATPLTGGDYDDAWAAVVDSAPGFADYKVKAGARVIPVVRLTPRAGR